MPNRIDQLEEVARFIREHRNDERNFEKLYEKLTETEDHSGVLREIREKHAAVYLEKKEKGISAWPEFENFVSHFEKAITKALQEQS